MLQNMQRKIDEEGKKQEEAYDKFMRPHSVWPAKPLSAGHVSIR